MKVKSNSMKKTVLVAVCAAMALGHASAQQEVRVSPGSGSLEHARDAVREAIKANGGRAPKGGISVILEDGTYVLERPIEFTAEDSGTSASPITWRAAHRGKAVLSGMRRDIREVEIDWAKLPASLIPESSRSHVRCWELGGDDPLPGFYSGGCCARPDLDDFAVCVFSGGERCESARWPGKSFARTGKPLGEATTAKDAFGSENKQNNTGVFEVSDAPFEKWAQEPDLWAYGMYGMEWSNISSPVLKADPVVGTLAVEPSKNQFGFREYMPFFVFNAFSSLDREGMWAIDRKARRVYVWARDANPPLIAGAEALLKGEGVANVSFDGFVFEVVRGDAISFSHAKSVSIVASCVRHINGNAIDFKKSRLCRVEGCDIYDLGRHGILLDGGDRVTLTPGENVADNCHIHHYGRISPNYNPGISLSGCGNRATHNLIHHSPHQALGFGGNDHYVGFNICHDCCTFTDDAGTFYCCMRDWTMRGTVIEYNTIHMTGKQPRTKHVRGIYLDDWSSGMIVRGNIINRAPQGVYLGGGNGNVVARNVIFNTPEAICIGSRGMDSFARSTTRHGSDSWIYKKYMRAKGMWNKSPWLERYPMLPELEKLPTPIDAHNANFNEVSNNLCVATGGITTNNWDAIRERTVIADNLETDCDPGFVDYAGFNWELKSDSPARKTLGGGTRFGEMGLYDSKNRFSPAIKHGEGMTPPRPLGVEKLSALVDVLVRYNKRTLAGRTGIEAEAEWKDYVLDFVPEENGTAALRLSNWADREKTEYADLQVEGAELKGSEFQGACEVRWLKFEKGRKVTVSLKARRAPNPGYEAK